VLVAVVLFGVYVFFVKLCHENSWSSVSVKGQSVTKNDELVFSTLKFCNKFSLPEHAFTQNTSSSDCHAFCIVSSSVLHSGNFVSTVEEIILDILYKLYCVIL